MSIPLLATYRLQLNADFTLHDARARVPYLKALGISHLYCSPVLAAGAGSTHGYDVADPTQVSAALGGDEAFVALADTTHAHGMGILLDIVPNHMGIGPENPYWTDVLTHGRSSRYADWFDVSWRATTKRLADRVLVPVLGDTLERVLARDELWLETTDNGVRIRYFDHHFPIDPATIPADLHDRAWSTGDAGRARMRALLAKQHYELAFWRVAQRDVNYRRFFDVNELICLRVEEPAVFDATHRTVLRFVADGIVDGLRVDHIDGLLEPGRYLHRLRAAVDARRPAAPGAPRFPIVVEKILASGEQLPEHWPVDGTTGYEFMTALEDIFIHPEGYAALEAKYRVGRAEGGFHAVAVDSKRRVLRSTLNADVRRIAPMLARVARRAGWAERPIAAYAGAIVELVAWLPVYRTYIDAEHPDAFGADHAVLTEALAQVRAGALADAQAVDALERALLGEWHDVEPVLARARLSFVLRWQQLTGPAAAKGVEDTALYVYAPLASRNEVGGDPGIPVEGAAARLHERLSERAKRHPRALNATNTHDTKRSADVRARLDALSEHSVEWERALRRWRRRHRRLRTLVNGRLVPTRTADNFVYQALLGLWTCRPERSEGPAFSRATAKEQDLRSAQDDISHRLTAYVQKAMREAKVSTSWTDPDAQFEDAIAQFLGRLLDRSTNADWMREVDDFVATLAPQTLWNALGRLVVHLTAPGVPDLYQGDELWFAALVDPDNRRPVDWADRAAALDVAERAATSPERGAQLIHWRDTMQASELKMFVIRELLAFRRDHAQLLSCGGYERVEVAGVHADNIFAFRRFSAGEEVVVAVPRFTRALGPVVAGSAWGDTRLVVGADSATEWTCLIHGAARVATHGVLAASECFSELPVAVLQRNRLREPFVS